MFVIHLSRFSSRTRRGTIYRALFDRSATARAFRTRVSLELLCRGGTLVRPPSFSFFCSGGGFSPPFFFLFFFFFFFFFFFSAPPFRLFSSVLLCFSRVACSGTQPA